MFNFFRFFLLSTVLITMLVIMLIIPARADIFDDFDKLIPVDKQVHFYVNSIAVDIEKRLNLPKEQVIVNSLVVGIGKEVFDGYSGGIFNSMDIVAGMLGCIFGIIINY